MKKNRLLSILIAVVFTVVLVAGCTPTETTEPAEGSQAAETSESAVAESSDATVESDEEIVIACLCNTYVDYMVNVLAGFEGFAAEHDNVTYTLYDAEENSALQLQQLENVLATDVDAIVIKLVDTATGPNMLEMIRETDIPVVAVTTQMEGADSFIYTDNSEAGTMQAEAVAEDLNGEGNVVILLGNPDLEFTTLRTEAVEAYFADYPGINIVGKDTAMWMRDQAMTLMENWIQADIQIDAVVSNADEMAIGAMLAAEEAGLEDIKYYGMDGLEAYLQYMNEGKLTFTLWQDAYGQGYAGIETAYKIAMGEKVDKVVSVPFVRVTQDNLQEMWKKIVGTDEIPPID